MRVLIVSDSYPPLIGGATRASQLLARRLADRGHEVCVATSWQPGSPVRERDASGVHVRRLHGLVTRAPWLSADPYRRIPPPFPDPETTLRFRHLLRAFAPDVVHAYGWLTYSCALAMTGMGLPLVVSARDYGHVCPIRTLLRHGEPCSGPGVAKCLECAGGEYGQPKAAVAVAGVLGGRRLLRRHLAGVHSVSAYVQDVMARTLPRGGPVPDRVVPDFRDEAGTDVPDPGILATLPDEPFILFVGALRRIKGVHELLEAYGRLEGAPPLVLIGTRAPDTPERFPDGVRVLYDVPFATVMAAWDRALFGVAPSTLPEPLGNVVHEAMSRGRAVIGTVPGGHSDMIDAGRTGLLVGAGDVSALEAALRELVADPARTRAMGETARATAPRFTAGAVVPEIERLYADAIAHA